MQFDPDRTFGDIHKDSKSLCDNIEEIIDIALVEAPGDEPLNLRFVTPRDQSDDWYLNDACAEYELTAPGYRTDYTAVSYCWSHSQSTAGLAQIPEYNVYDAFDGDLPPRPVRCPKIVFHRAFAFARKYKIRYVWIDQECINQYDPADIEKHLQRLEEPEVTL